jgi:Uma2 family endonuclease
MTPTEYLAYEQEQSIRHEMIDGYLYAMTGVSDRHEEVALGAARNAAIPISKPTRR